MAGIGSRLDSQIHPAEKFGYIQPFSMEEQSFSAPERGGAAFSQIKRTEQEEELRTRTQERLTLDDVRWSDMRKKVPLMGRVPVSKINETADDESFQTLKFQHISYIRQNFKQLECQKFIPNPKELPGTDKVEHLKCYCGETLKSHVPYDITPQGRKNYGNLIPMELKPFIDIHDLSKKVPDKLPTLKWTKEEALKEKYTTSFGKVQFTGMEQVGGMKPAKYLRLKDELRPDVVDYAINLMKVHWRIMEPRTPSLVISVVGGAKNFKLSGKMRETFQSGLIKASKTTNAWLITSGFNMGVMKEVGLAVREGQSFEWYKDRFAHVLRCIGIAPWGYVKNRDVMTDHNVSYILGKFDKIAEYKTSNVIEHRKPVPLNSDHTHFIFVDDGFRNSYQGAAEFRARFEKKLSDPVSKGGEGIPVVLIVVEGGRDAIEDAKTSLDQNIPVILCEGTGRAADILVYAYNNPERRSKIVNMIKKAYFEVKPEDKTKEAIVKKANSDAEKVYESVEKCIAKKYLISIFHINKHEELDNEILKILLKAKMGEATETQSLERLKLALKWDRADIAQEEIFREDALWSRGSLDDVLKDAMLSDNVKFVQIIMNQGVVMKDYLTLPRLMILYREALEIEDINNRPLKNVMTKLRIDKLNKDTLVVILKRLMDKFELDMEENVEDTEEEKPEENRFKYPYKHLLVWSLLLLRQNMANLALKMGGEPITSTVAASRIHYSLATFIHRNESSLKSRVETYKVEFDDLATVILDECHERDPNKAMMLAERRSPMWSNMTSMEIAASADNQTFLASVACQNSIGTIWKRGVTSSWQKVFLVSMFPFLAFTPLLDVEKLGDRTISGWQKFLTFVTSPIAKFTYHSLTYMVFLLLFTYFSLVEFRTAHVTTIEILCVIWIFTYIIDNIYTFLAFPSPTLKGTLRDWFGLLKGSDYANCILAVIAFFLHYGGTSYSPHAKAIYCVNVMVFYIRVMEIYRVNSRLGPKLVMIKRMMLELVIFILVLTIFLCAYGIARQGLLYLQRESDWVILKDVLYEPYWNFYGYLNLDEINDDDVCQKNPTLVGLPDHTYCKSFHWLVPIILAAYLLIANVLLLNLLIAIFSNVFHEVEVNSNRIWKYQMYMLVMEYDTKAALVPPFSLVIHLYLIIKWIFRKTCCRKSKGRQYGSRHLEYLQLFEKEQLCNYLRKKKSEAKSDTDISILSLQKRIDELYKMIKEDFMDETDQPTVDRENSRVGHETLTATKTAESTSLAKAIQPANEIEVAEKVEEEKKDKKHKKKKKKKKQRENEEKVLNIDQDIKKPEAENEKMVPHFLEENQTLFSKISTPPSLQKKKYHQQRRHDRSLESDSDDDNRPRSVRMNIRQEFDNSDVNDFSSVRKNIRSLSRSHDSNTEEEKENRGSKIQQKPRSLSRHQDSNTEEEKEYRGSKIRQKN